MEIANIISTICGIVIIILLLWIFISRRKGIDSKIKYTEHQLEVRGIGYMKAFYTLIAWLCFVIFTDIIKINIPATNIVICFTGILIASLVLVCYCIMNDAYWGRDQDHRNYIYVLIGLGLINLVIGVFDIINGNLIINGIIQDNFIIFETGIFVMCIGICLLIKKYKRK